jgi:hypothetical protein
MIINIGRNTYELLEFQNTIRISSFLLSKSIAHSIRLAADSYSSSLELLYYVNPKVHFFAHESHN